MWTISKLLLQLIAGYAACWFAVYLMIAMPHATPMEVLTAWDDAKNGSLIVFGASFVLYVLLAGLYIFIKSYKQ